MIFILIFFGCKMRVVVQSVVQQMKEILQLASLSPVTMTECCAFSSAPSENGLKKISPSPPLSLFISRMKGPERFQMPSILCIYKSMQENFHSQNHIKRWIDSLATQFYVRFHSLLIALVYSFLFFKKKKRLQ